MKPQFHSHKTVNPRAGFALVITLSLMILLTLLAVGLLSLSAVTLRVSRQGEDAAAARANARLAMLLALGELQKLTGPDQRVTATAAILQSNANTVGPNDSWVGVWRSDRFKSEKVATPILTADARRGSGYSDRRSASRAKDKKDECIGWLVSGKLPNPATALAETDSVLVRSGTTPVRAATTEVAARSGAGRLAWFVQDESTKAHLALTDPWLPKPPNTADETMNRWLSPLTHDPKPIFKGERADASQTPKLASTAQLELSTLAGGASQEDIQELTARYADSFTVYSRSVLADVYAGGLKSDLTAYLEGSNARSRGSLRGIDDTTAICRDLGDSRRAPRFVQLRGWYDLRKKVTKSSGGSHVIDNQMPVATPADKIRMVDPGTGFVAPVIQPVMTEAVYYLNHVIDTSGGTTRMVETIYPRVVLWNPFAVRLRTSGHIAFFDFHLSQTITCSFRRGGGAVEEQNMSYGSSNNPAKMLGFHLPSVDLEPGEAVVFCAPNRETPFNANDLRANALSPTAGPGKLGFFTREWSNNNLGANVDRASMSFHYVFNGNVFWNYNPNNGRTQTITLHALSGSSGVTGPALMSPGGPLVVRQLSMDNYSRGNNGRWMPTYRKTAINTLEEARRGIADPDTLLALGGRLRFFYETYANRTHGQSFGEPWYYAPLIHHNIHAPNIHRWPTDNLFGLQYAAVSGTGGSGPHLYSYGPMAQARQWSPWLDTEVMPRRAASGNQRTAVFSDASFATTTSLYPITDLPLPDMPVTSLGALQHVQLSPFAWHPTHTIGQSFASPFMLLANATSQAPSLENDQWSNKTTHLAQGTNTDITGSHRYKGQILFNDLSYEVNQALWDRYFLSAIPRSSSARGKWDPARPLPNPRLAINPTLSQGGSLAELTDFHRAARSLWLEGGFNVHSTDVNAWKCILRSFRDIPVPTLSGSMAADKASVFPGHAVPVGTTTTTAFGADRERFWKDFRALSDREIDLLAAAIIAQVRKRAPFCGMGDFVNRRLVTATDTTRRELGLSGTLQAAIDQVTSINETGSSNNALRLPTLSECSTYTYGAAYWGGPVLVPEPQNYQAFQLPASRSARIKGADAASQLTQADILQQLGPVLVARGDTFVIRAYGEARDATGKTTARAWCEAVVQRTPEPVTPDASSENLNPLVVANRTDWGRRYQIQSFRWLTPEEI